MISHLTQVASIRPWLFQNKFRCSVRKHKTMRIKRVRAQAIFLLQPTDLAALQGTGRTLDLLSIHEVRQVAVQRSKERIERNENVIMGVAVYHPSILLKPSFQRCRLEDLIKASVLDIDI
jgi:hypothetical protein